LVSPSFVSIPHQNLEGRPIRVEDGRAARSGLWVPSSATLEPRKQEAPDGSVIRSTTSKYLVEPKMPIRLVALVFVETLKTIMPLGFSKGSTCRSGTSLRE